MTRQILLAATAFSVALAAGSAQQLFPIIKLTPEETSQARQAAADSQAAMQRRIKGTLEWKTFQDTLIAQHPELPGLRFSSDLRVAYARQNAPQPLGYTIALLELTPGQQRQAQALQRESIESAALDEQTQKHWADMQFLIASHHATPGKSTTNRTLSTGQSVTISLDWQSGVTFTSDFRFGTTREY